MKKEIFEVGKWYHWGITSGPYFLKILRIIDTTVTYCEYINIRTNVHAVASSTFDITEKAWGGKVSITEVKKYLPKGHEDLLLEDEPEEVVKVEVEDHSYLIELFNRLDIK